MRTLGSIALVVAGLSGCGQGFDLLSPSNGAVGIGPTPTLKWEDVGSETGYLLEIDAEATFQTPLVYVKALSSNQTSAMVPSGILQTGKTYFWRVTATNSTNQLRATNGPFSFTPGNPSVPPWSVRIGSVGPGSRSDKLSAVRATGDGGVLIAGWSDSGGPTGLWVLKLDKLGSLLWQRRFPGLDQPSEAGMEVVEDGGCIVVSSVVAGDGSVLRLGPTGEVLWHRTYGGSGSDSFQAVHRMQDGGWLVGGRTGSFGAQMNDAWLLRLTTTGGILWQKRFGGSKNDSVRAVRATGDGGCIVAADTESLGSGSGEIWLLKFAGSGAIQWQKTYGGVHWPRKYSDERVVGVEEIPGKGYLVAGNVSGSVGWDEYFSTSSDLLLFRVDLSGAVVWKKTLGGDEEDSLRSARATADGGFIVSGTTHSFSPDSSAEFFSLKLDSAGSVLWRRTYAGSAFAGASIRPAADGGYFLGGDVVASGASWLDWRIMRLAPDGTLGGISGNVGGEMEEPTLKVKSSGVTPKTSAAAPVSVPLAGSVAALQIASETP